MTTEEARARYRYLQLKAKMAESAASEEAPTPTTDVDKMKAAIMGQNKALGLSTGREYQGAGELAKDLGVGAVRTLDYTGGLARTGVYAVPRAVKTIYEQDPAQAEAMQQDLLMALQGQAPTSNEQLQKLGVEELGAVNVPLLGRVTGRGALGLLSDALTAGGASSALRSAAASGSGLATALRAPEAATEALIKAGGKKIYQSGLKGADIVAKRFGKGEKALSETLLKKRITGNATQIADQALEYADELRARQQEILAEASANGARVDMGKVLAPLKRDVSKIMSETNTLGVKNAAESFGKELDNLIESGSAIPEKIVREGAGQQGALFSQAELPVARQVRQAAVNADEALRGSTSASPEILATGAGVASKADDLAILEEQLRRAQMSKPQQLDLLNPESGLFNQSELPVPGVSKQAYVNADLPIQTSAPRGQMELLPNAESVRISSPAAYVDESVQYAAQPGQVPLIPESQMMQPAKTTVIPGREALTVSKASEIKTQLGNQAGDQAFDLFRKSKPGSKLFKRAQNRTKIAVEQSVGKFNKARGAELKEVNRELGNILTSKPVLAAEARKEAMKNAITSVDAPLAILSPQAAIVKKLADIAKGTGARTRTGASLYYNPYEYLNTARTGAINVGNGNE